MRKVEFISQKETSIVFPFLLLYHFLYGFTKIIQSLLD